MTAEERIALKEQMEKRLLELEKEITDLKELTKPIAPSDAIGRVSRMDAINNKSVNEAALRSAETNLKKLKFALEKVDDEDFGVCARCKNPIPPARLMLMPHSPLCVNCAA